jgi:hypothetical protein
MNSEHPIRREDCTQAGALFGYSVFRRLIGRAAEITALSYGVAMGLAFDEFGMWLHLGGSYWQRASVDEVIVVSALFGLVAFARTLKRFAGGGGRFWNCHLHGWQPHRRCDGADASGFGVGFFVIN